MALSVWIYKHQGKSYSNDGLSENADEVTVVNIPDGPSYVRPNDDAPAVLLVSGNLPGTARLVPAEPVGNSGAYEPVRKRRHAGPMFGGCYADSSDERWIRAVEAITGRRPDGPVALHDRFESAELFAAMSDGLVKPEEVL